MFSKEVIYTIALASIYFVGFLLFIGVKLRDARRERLREEAQQLSLTATPNSKSMLRETEEYRVVAAAQELELTQGSRNNGG